jgi:hypothetical protein
MTLRNRIELAERHADAIAKSPREMTNRELYRATVRALEGDSRLESPALAHHFEALRLAAASGNTGFVSTEAIAALHEAFAEGAQA